MTPPAEDNHLLRIGLAQIAPVWLDRERTILKVKTYVERASQQGCHLVAFGEALVPGYPFWLELTDGARFNSSLQKSILPSTRSKPCSRRLGTSMDCVQRRQRIALPSIWERWSAPPTVARTASIVP
jgi:predicted amidohydrolase